MSRWNIETTTRARELLAEGKSASQVAFHLGPTFTRNMVIGYARRNHVRLKNRRFGVRVKNVIDPVTQTSVPFADKYAWRTVRVPAHRDTIRAVVEIEDDGCRWPIGEVREPGFKFCCASKLRGSSYCETHAVKSIDVTNRWWRREKTKAQEITGQATWRKEPV